MGEAAGRIAVAELVLSSSKRATLTFVFSNCIVGPEQDHATLRKSPLRPTIGKYSRLREIAHPRRC